MVGKMKNKQDKNVKYAASLVIPAKEINRAGRG